MIIVFGLAIAKSWQAESQLLIPVLNFIDSCSTYAQYSMNSSQGNKSLSNNSNINK